VDFFPLFLDLRGRTVLVLGEGPAAVRKAALVRGAGAEVRAAKSFSPALLDGAALAIGAEATEEDLAALAAAARARGIPVNVVDRPELCTAIMPAVVDRAPVTVAISSGGAAPVLARLIRSRIETILSPRTGRLAALAARLRDETVRRLPDTNARRRMLERAFTGTVAERVFADDETGAEAEYRALLDRGPEAPEAAVFFVRAAAPDLLTLRAARILGAADVVVHDADAPADVVDLARRDAERIVAGPDVAGRLVALARAGKLVVRLGVADDGHARTALAAAGIASVALPSVT
jgi:uroporphyrin-III C-methyltransferase / precorrin-2 dehydrogenase / sirohydrochlorin ferrochelatase